jgi:hypothetical protein
MLEQVWAKNKETFKWADESDCRTIILESQKLNL